MSYAGFWKRFAAILIDTIITSLVSMVIGAMFGFIMAIAITDNLNVIELMGNILGVLLGWLYFAVMESSHNQATLGKMALGIKVTDTSGGRISFGRASGRHFAKFISSILLFIGFIMVAFTQRKQGLHDMMASCLVINK